MKRYALGSIGIAFSVLALKLLAWWLTGSIALLSDALESVINVLSATAAFLALRLSAQPADANHPYGHRKAEDIFAAMEGTLILMAALLILREAWHGFMAPQPIEQPVLGLAVNGVASVLNGVWATLLIRIGRSQRSLTLVAEGRHLYTDVVTSAGVFLGIALVAATGWVILDPLVAALVALQIMWSGGQLIRESLAGLMDAAVAPATLERICEVISASSSGAIEAHDLRTRLAGPRTFIEFHLVVPGGMTVEAAHMICDRIEAALRQAIGESIISIHVEPEGKAKHQDDPRHSRTLVCRPIG